MEKKIIGTNSLTYNPKRNFGGLPFTNYVVEKRLDLFRIFNHFYFKIFKRSHSYFSNSYFDFGINRVSLYHFFNVVPITRKPWVVTYENEIPRPYLHSNFLLRRLAAPNCLRIIAFCDRARRVEEFLLNSHPRFKDVILKKLIVIQPAQELRLNSIDEKNYDRPLVFTFVGVDFYRKGGLEVLKAVERLLKDGFDLRLNIVSKLNVGKWKDEHISLSDQTEARDIIKRNPTIIKHDYSLPPGKVLDLFLNSHVALLPSFGETYGYVVLEAQACGCPVITPNLPPFEEFNSNDRGWLLDVPSVERFGVKESDLKDGRSGLFCRAIEEGLYLAMKEALLDKELVRLKAINSLEYIRTEHSPEKTASLIEAIYDEAFSK